MKIKPNENKKSKDTYLIDLYYYGYLMMESRNSFVTFISILFSYNICFKLYLLTNIVFKKYLSKSSRTNLYNTRSVLSQRKLEKKSKRILLLKYNKKKPDNKNGFASFYLHKFLDSVLYQELCASRVNLVCKKANVSIFLQIISLLLI